MTSYLRLTPLSPCKPQLVSVKSYFTLLTNYSYLLITCINILLTAVSLNQLHKTETKNFLKIE
uniref:Uncharacterized protein n=1 Tax=Siphoviridae sp. ctuUw41 TaxID=2826503 RepID=A0A8S5MYV1_9CAUD|nr:MAG TPA: hypothetical protein [Siphoviridae sp. ctuUw41]